MVLTTGTALSYLFGFVIAYMGWTLRKCVNKVDELDVRVTRIETLLEVLGDIKSDINIIKTDVEVIKSNYSKD